MLVEIARRESCVGRAGINQAKELTTAKSARPTGSDGSARMESRQAVADGAGEAADGEPLGRQRLSV